jgi:hypothetical protein
MVIEVMFQDSIGSINMYWHSGRLTRLRTMYPKFFPSLVASILVMVALSATLAAARVMSSPVSTFRLPSVIRISHKHSRLWNVDSELSFIRSLMHLPFVLSLLSYLCHRTFIAVVVLHVVCVTPLQQQLSRGIIITADALNYTELLVIQVIDHLQAQDRLHRS